MIGKVLFHIERIYSLKSSLIVYGAANPKIRHKPMKALVREVRRQIFLRRPQREEW